MCEEALRMMNASQWADIGREAMFGAPAQEEREMDDYQIELGIAEDTAERERKKAKKRRRKLRERWDRAFYAALTGVCTNIDLSESEHVRYAEAAADEVIRRGTASRDAAIAEVVG